MKEGFTFNRVSLKFLRKVIFKNFAGGGGTEKSQQMFQAKSKKAKNNKDLLGSKIIYYLKIIKKAQGTRYR